MQPEQSETTQNITDEAVSGYLMRHPDFFVNHHDTLSRLRVPHESGSAVSLIEKQVSVLRSRCGYLEKSLQELIAVARQNENVHQHLHTLIQNIISATDLIDIVAQTRQCLRDSFHAEEVYIMLIAPAPKRADRKKEALDAANSATEKPRQKTLQLPVLEGATMVKHTDKRIKAFREVFSIKQTVCGMPKAEQLKALVGKDHAHVASAAIIPLHFERRLGVVMLTSRDEKRFGASKGVMFLNQMGELLGRRIHSHNAFAAVADK